MMFRSLLKSKNKKQILLGFGIVFPVILLIAAIKFFQVRAAIAEHSGFKMPPESITSTVATTQQWKSQFKAIGSLASVQGSMLSTEVIGRISKINVESGQDVEKGTIIIELDTTVETANLKEAQAKLERSRKKVQRYDQLRSTKAVSPENLDDAEMEFRTAQASVQALQSIIDRKNIAAPFSGRVGIRQVNVGQIVLPGNWIVPLYSLSPLYVNFSVPQQLLAKIRVGGNVSVTLDAFPGEFFQAQVTAIDPMVSESSRNVAVQATIPNLDKRLSPGMFISAIIDLPEVQSYPVIPSSSISYAPYGDSIYVIETMKDKDGAEYKGVRQQMVQLGVTQGDLVQITSGLKEGEEVVTSGVFKLRPNAAVSVNNSIQPSSSKNPNPADT
jgi:membrane fusion protein (multidrug efflux system)